MVLGLIAFIAWVSAIAVVTVFGQGQSAGTALTILGGCVGVLAVWLRPRR